MSQQTALSRRSFLGVLPAGLLAGTALAQEAAVGGGSSPSGLRSASVLFVRHTEKESTPDDPGLTDVGRQRARGLAAFCRALPVSHLFATELRRTQETLAPLAEQTGLPVVEYGARHPGALVRQLEVLDGGQCIVVAGHSNTLPKLVELLGGPSLTGLDTWGFVPEVEYDRVILQALMATGDDAPLRAIQTLDLRLGLVD